MAKKLPIGLQDFRRDKDEEGLLSLDYPNKEVRDAMLEHLIEGFVGVEKVVKQVNSLRLQTHL